MPVVKEYINKALGDLPAKREKHEYTAKFVKGEIRNDDSANDSFADKVITTPKSTP